MESGSTTLKIVFFTKILPDTNFKMYFIDNLALEHAYAFKIPLQASFLAFNKMVKKFPIISELGFEDHS